MGRVEPGEPGDGAGAGAGEVGSSSLAVAERSFPPAAQPEIMRAAEKDDHYASYVHDACRDAIRHLFGLQLLEEFYLFSYLLWCSPIYHYFSLINLVYWFGFQELGLLLHIRARLVFVYNLYQSLYSKWLVCSSSVGFLVLNFVFLLNFFFY